MQKFKIFLICYLISTLSFPQKRKDKAIHHLHSFLKYSGIKGYRFEEK